MAEEAEVGGHVVLQKAEGEGGPQVTEVLSNGCILGRGGGGRGECSALCSARCTAVLTGVRACGCADERMNGYTFSYLHKRRAKPVPPRRDRPPIHCLSTPTSTRIMQNRGDWARPPRPPRLQLDRATSPSPFPPSSSLLVALAVA